VSQRIVIACKKTAREFFAERYGENWRAVLERFDLELAEVEQEHQEHYRTVEELVRAFLAHGIVPEVLPSRRYDRAAFTGASLVISVGGDGEMLDVARYVPGEELIVGFRSGGGSVGRLLAPAGLSPAELAAQYFAGRYRVERWTRLEGTVRDGGPTITDLALNEIYVGDRYSVGTARYTLHFGDQEEKQRSSGILVSTGAGSTGWYANVVVATASGYRTGEPFPPDSPELRFVVRDLIRTPGGATLSAGTIPPEGRLIIKSTMNSDGLVSFDCSKLSYENARAYAFNRGATGEIRARPGSLRVLQPERPAS